MIYLRNITDAQVAFVPKSGRLISGSLVLTLKNTIDLVYRVESVTDIHTSTLYYNIAIELPEEITPGEYEYTLGDGNGVLSTGILVVGESTHNAEQYEKTITYEQYQTE